MPRIFDNIELELKEGLINSLKISSRADFCVGYFNLRGWKIFDSYIDKWSGEKSECCRLLIGMQRLPQKGIQNSILLSRHTSRIDNQKALKLKKDIAYEFRKQLIIGTPTNLDEAGLQKLAEQIQKKKVIIKLFLTQPLHAKLYLLYRDDPNNPCIGFLGSSNLTLSGLSKQGELNIDVVDQDTTLKLEKWFEDRWNDRWCLDISDDIAQIINESWARNEFIYPYYIYLKIVYHLSRDARAGLSDFTVPKVFGNKLFEFQSAAVRIAAHHLYARGGVLIGDVVGLGKTLIAVALARIFEDDFGYETLIICPKNLVQMWEEYRDEYRLHAKVLSMGLVQNSLSNMRRYRIVIIDESHNLRNRNTKRFRAVRDYVTKNESRCILLTATPYNKTYEDLSNQLRLFISDDSDLGVRPEVLIREIGRSEFIRQYQISPRSLRAFDHSCYSADWRELMRLFLVRRTRSFVKQNYASTDQDGSKYLLLENGERAYFPERTPKTIVFKESSQYSSLFSNEVVAIISQLELPRYGLANYVTDSSKNQVKGEEAKIIADLNRAGKRLMGFCRTNLFKRLESSGHAFLLSIERHAIRNFVFIHAIENELQLPIGSADVGFFFSDSFDGDNENVVGNLFSKEELDINDFATESSLFETKQSRYKEHASELYQQFFHSKHSQFKWIDSSYFTSELLKHLDSDASALLKILLDSGTWNVKSDTKFNALLELIQEDHAQEKILVFTQYADTARYLEEQLKAKGIDRVACVTGGSPNPTKIAQQFSPKSNQNDSLSSSVHELRVLIATDVLSEGQNLQDCAIVVNFDLPWAIIRLIQRVGRVDRIGQLNQKILCYSFLPAAGVEQLLKLRARVRNRLHEEAEVVGTDEAFFEDDDKRVVRDLYNEKKGILDEDEKDTDVDLASHAYQIWKNATAANPHLVSTIENLPSVVYSAKSTKQHLRHQNGVIIYMRSSYGYDTMAWVDHNGESVTENQYEILQAAECRLDEPAVKRHENHHSLVASAFDRMEKESNQFGGELGKPSHPRFKTYERLKEFAINSQNQLFVDGPLKQAIQDIYDFPLTNSAKDTLRRQFKLGISDRDLANLIISLSDQNKLCVDTNLIKKQNSEIICSIGLTE